MLLKPSRVQSNSIFKRRTLVLQNNHSRRQPEPPPQPLPEQKLGSLPLPQHEEPCTALVINSSHEMAKEITLQLTLAMPACSIMYAPTIETAKWTLTRRKIDLIVASQILPDGGINKLQEVMQKLASPPDLVVVGALSPHNFGALAKTGYQCSAFRRINAQPKREPPQPQPLKQDNIKTLGADIRNDLNNPLQEIVAMVFVAKTGAEVSNASVCALDAIERAAKNMAKVVNSLEDKIRGAVGS